MKNRTILISGASIAGPALAYWLRRYGFQPTIVERAPAPRGGGQAIDLRGAARQVAERMSLMADIRRAHTGAKGMYIVNSEGKRIAAMSADLLGDSGGLIADIEIQRGDLVRILYDATKNDSAYRFNDSITALSQGEDGFSVSFERGAPQTFDLVVGADGLHSTVRRLAFGDEAQFTRDLGCYVSIFAAHTNLNLDGWEQMYRMPGGTAALYPMRGIHEARAMFYFASPQLGYDRHNISEQQQIVAQAFAGAGWEVPHMLEAMREAPDFYFDRVAQIKMDHWSNGRVALLGDAGYCPSPMTGMGTSLALVGAYVLAGELAAAEGDHRTAFARYESELRAYVNLAQKQVNGALGFLLPKSNFQVWSYNQMWRMLPYMPWKGLIASGFQKVANAITLKEYSRYLVEQPTNQAYGVSSL
jgi:2-polyprenyl-6-methoxyphenol hydroxylase-like FAD-dependent oxidoreductase